MKSYWKILIVLLAIGTASFTFYECGKKPSGNQILDVLTLFCLIEANNNPPDWCSQIFDLYTSAHSRCAECPIGYELGSCQNVTTVSQVCDSFGSCEPELEIKQEWVGEDEGGGLRGCGRTEGVDPYTACGRPRTCYAADGTIVNNPQNARIANNASSLSSAQTLLITPDQANDISSVAGIAITFSKSIDPARISAFGTIGNIQQNQIIVAKKNQYNDSVFITPNSAWNLGINKNLTINAVDIDGFPVTQSLTYAVYAAGTSAIPDFNTCSPSCKVGWTAPYSFQFNGSGGVPPYNWYSSGPMPPGASLSSSGLLSGPATWNVLGLYTFAVIIVDSAGNTTTNDVTIDSTDPITACYLLGVCH